MRSLSRKLPILDHFQFLAYNMINKNACFEIDSKSTKTTGSQSQTTEIIILNGLLVVRLFKIHSKIIPIHFLPSDESRQNLLNNRLASTRPVIYQVNECFKFLIMFHNLFTNGLNFKIKIDFRFDFLQCFMKIPQLIVY